TDPSGRPIRAKVHMQILFAGVPVGQVDNGKTFTFLGTWREPKKAPVIWPARSRGRPLTFEALVTARGQTKKLDYSIRVRKSPWRSRSRGRGSPIRTCCDRSR